MKRPLIYNHWSIRNFAADNYSVPPDEFFFATFGEFAAAVSDEYNKLFLKELIERANGENVSYLEIMVASPVFPEELSTGDMNRQLTECIGQKNESKFLKTLLSLHHQLENCDTIQTVIREFCNNWKTIHEKTKHNRVTTLYQTYAARNADPLKVFAQLYMGYKVCEASDHFVGVNIVQAENGDNSIRDYWGHMRMFQFLSKCYQKVHTALHAGELKLGLVPPEELKYHITDAVYIANAKRIGHGVDIAHETRVVELLKTMKNRDIAVEINLTSNEFILDVKETEHPILLYFKNEVPIVICTDDPGILRTNLSEQYVIAATRYPELKYGDFKQFVFNSIQYSFANQADKNKLRDTLNREFATFEKNSINNFTYVLR